MVGHVNVQGKTQPINKQRLTEFGSWDYDERYFEFTPQKSLFNSQLSILVFRKCYIETVKINEVTNSLLHQHTSQKLVETFRNHKHLDHNKSIQ